MALATGACVGAAGGGDAEWTLDETFRPAITTRQGAVLFAVAAQPDGKVLIAGDFALVGGVPRAGVARLEADGAVDLAFDAGRGVDGLVYALAVQPDDGKVLIAGQFTAVDGVPRGGLARLHPDGRLDQRFRPLLEGPTGAYVSVLWLQSDGRILVGGNFRSVADQPRPGLARLTAEGYLDRGFDPAAGLEGGVAHDLAQQADGRILVGGSFTHVGGVPRAGLARLHPDGRVDTTFDADLGAGEGPGQVYALGVDPDRGIVVAGVFDRAGSVATSGLIRLNFEGDPDPGFEADAGVAGGQATLYDLQLLPGGELLVTGSFWYAGGAERMGLARLTAEGVVDATFEPGPGLGTDESAFGNMLALQPDGQVLVAGQFEEAGGSPRHCLARFTDDGRVDPGFSGPNMLLEFGGTVRAIAPLRGGGVLIGGDFERVDGEWRHGVARLTEDGRVDPGFDAALNAGAVIHAVAVQPDGRLLVGGEFDRVAEFERRNFARLLGDGTLDEGFVAAAAEASVEAIALLPDGRVLVGGAFRQFGNLRRFGLVRLSSEGEPDPGFEPRFEIGLDRALVLALKVQPDGRVVVGGYFDSVNGQARRSLARVFEDGGLDPDFAMGVDVDSAKLAAAPVVRAIGLRADGRLFVGGGFRALDGRARLNLARLYGDGCLDASFDPVAGGGPTSPGRVAAVALLEDGRVIVAEQAAGGSAGTAGQLTVWTPQGDRTTSVPFEGDGGAEPLVTALATTDDGALLAGGSFQWVNGQPRWGLARFRLPPAGAFPNRLAITERPGGVRVHWDGPGRLFEAETLAGPWNEVEGAFSPLDRPVDPGARFYRLAE